MSQKQLDKQYDPTKVEDQWYQYWEDHQLFHADEHTEKPTYTIVIPPPNVTGMLTMGHILNNTLQDLLIRYKKMRGYETLWMPGTDHAGIATQSKVEAALRKDGTTRHELGRERFLEKVWQWKENYGGIILQQLRKLGAACDWERECFTMDENLSQAVREVFVRLYEKGLIYRGHRLISWSPDAQTALADEEVNYEDEEGKFWHIAYPLKDGSGEVVVATTRPETMLGDTAVAVHPDDERYTDWIGKTVILPLVEREIPIIADEHADPEKGSGAVKITPAHDFNDFQVGLGHDLEQISVIDMDARMTEEAGPYAGLDRFEARERIVNDLETQGLLRKVESIVIPVPRCYRTHCVIEPLLSDQWFVKMKPLAEPALQAVRSGKIAFHPKHWEETYFHWMENIRDWCISRQIWWGHRIPAWYCDNDHVTIARETPDACSSCGSTTLQQDEDVLDTWFSSWLWPFSTLGWPRDTQDLKVFFPTDTLVTGPDIIFFWVARMIMASLEFRDDIPFTDVYFNGMIRDMDNRKMSKSLGNSPDPLWLINGADKDTLKEFAASNPSYSEGVPPYGADAVRLTMVYLTPLGGDIRFDHTLVEMGQKFCNKLWNAARFVLMNLEGSLYPLNELDSASLDVTDRWILSRLNRVILEMENSIESFKFNDAIHALYDFVWSEFCDWYLELIKPRLYGEDDADKQVARSVVLGVLDRILRLLHPFAPFITEEIWQALPDLVVENTDPVKSIMIQRYPEADTARLDDTAEDDINILQQVISAIRNIRGEMNIPPGKEAELVLAQTDNTALDTLLKNELYIRKLARIGSIHVQSERPQTAASAVVHGLECYLPLADLIDVEVERNRLEKEIKRLENQIAGLEKKLNNENFISRAPKEVVDKERKKRVAFEENAIKLRKNLEQITG